MQQCPQQPHQQPAQPASSLWSTSVFTGWPATADCSDRRHNCIVPFTASEPSLSAEADWSSSYSLSTEYVDECPDFFTHPDLPLLYARSETFQSVFEDALIEVDTSDGIFL